MTNTPHVDAGDAWTQASRDIAKLHAEKPRPINKMFGANPTDEQKAKRAELMREWSKKDREARKRLKAAKAAANETVDESKSFTPAQLAQLRDQFASVERVDPTGPAYDKMIKLLDGMSQQQLKQVAGAGIKFLSKLALNRVKKAEAVGEARVRRVLWSTKVGNDTWGAAVHGPHFIATLNGEDYDFEDGEVYGLVAPKKVPPAIAARLEKSKQDFEADKQTTRESVQEARFQHGRGPRATSRSSNTTRQRDVTRGTCKARPTTKSRSAPSGWSGTSGPTPCGEFFLTADAIESMKEELEQCAG